MPVLIGALYFGRVEINVLAVGFNVDIPRVSSTEGD